MTAAAKIAAPKVRRVERDDRRTLQPVRRNSRLAGEEGRFWRRYSNREMGPALKAAERYDLVHKKKGERNGPLGHIGLQVFRALWGRVRFQDGRLDPSIDWLMRRCRRSKDAIVRALAALRDHGFVSWLRRFVLADGDQIGRRGPQVKQTSNAYALAVPDKAAALVRIPPPEDEEARLADLETQRKAHVAADSGLGEALDRLGVAVSNASPAGRMNPPRVES